MLEILGKIILKAIEDEIIKEQPEIQDLALQEMQKLSTVIINYIETKKKQIQIEHE